MFVYKRKRLGHRTGDQEIRLPAGCSTFTNDSGQVFTHVRLLSSRIIWYWSKGDDAVWRRR